MPFYLVHQDITRMEVDVIVNAANTDLRMGGGVCGAIFKAAGADDLQAACSKLAPIQTGQAVITPAFALSAKYIVHTAGPVYDEQDSVRCAALLRSSYTEALNLAHSRQAVSIAFPLISAGIYGYPPNAALEQASAAIKDFLQNHELDVYLTLFDKKSFAAVSLLQKNIEAFIDENYVQEELWHSLERRALAKPCSMDIAEAAPVPYFEDMICVGSAAKGIEDWVGNMDEAFSATLLRLIDAKGRTDVDVYKRANLDRKLFSKIRTDKSYTPSKRTVLALAISLELTLDETEDLLKRAGYALSHSRMFDLIVEYFILNGIYDIYLVNEQLFKYDQALLGV